jgi:hypothetical protein
MKEMKRFLAIISAIVTGALGLAIFAPHAVEAGFQVN